MSLLDDFRAQNPAYKDVPNDKLSDGLYNKFYAQKMSRDDFNSKLGAQPAAAPPQAAPAIAAQPAPIQPQPTAPAQKPIQAAPPQVAAEPSLPERIASDIGKRFETGKQIMTTPGQNPASVGLQMAGKVAAGTAGDIMAEIAKSAYSMLPESVKEKVSGGLQKVAASPMGQVALEAAKRGGEEYAAWAKQHPEAAANVESLVDIASVIPAGKAAGVASKVVTKPLGLEAMGKGMALESTPKLNKITKSMYDASQATADRITNGGVVFHPDVGSKLATSLDKVIKSVDGEQAVRAKDTIDAVNRFKDQISSGDTSLKNIFFQRKTLSDLTAKGGETGALARKALKEFDNVLADKDLAKKVVGGDAKSAKDIQLFNKQYRQYKSHEAIVDAITPPEGKAELSSNQIRSKMSKLADSEDFNYLSPEIQGLVKKAARGKTAGNILGATNRIREMFKGHGGAATVLGGIGSAVAGHPAGLGIAAGVLGGSAASRQIAKGTVADVLKAIQEGK